MLRTKIALGIDISDGLINLALLKKRKNGVKLLKVASGPVPDGAIKNGNIEDATALARAIKKLKAGNRIRAQHAALSLVANPVLMQILDLPEDVPGNIREFVRDEVKHYAILPRRNVAIDFCGIGSSVRSGGRRVLVVAADSQKITDATKALNRAGLNIDAIEPAMVAYIRACYAKKIAERFDRNLLFAILQKDVFSLCLFRNQTLCLVRTKRLEPDIRESDKCCEWVAEEINAVLQFYELETFDKRDKWEVTLVTGICNGSVKQKIASLGANVETVELEVRTPGNAYLDTPVADTNRDGKPSAIAVGLAMKLLDFPGGNLNVNLLPPEIIKAKLAEKQTLVVANVAVLILFLMILSIGFFSVKGKKAKVVVEQKRQMQLSQDIQALVKEQALLSRQVANISENLDRMNAVLSTGPFLRWGPVLNDIKLAIPKTVQITNLFSKNNSKMLLEGRALSSEAVYVFVDMLNACEHIKSASLIGTKTDSRSGGLVRYSINCLLVQ